MQHKYRQKFNKKQKVVLHVAERYLNLHYLELKWCNHGAMAEPRYILESLSMPMFRHWRMRYPVHIQNQATHSAWDHRCRKDAHGGLMGVQRRCRLSPTQSTSSSKANENRMEEIMGKWK